MFIIVPQEYYLTRIYQEPDHEKYTAVNDKGEIIGYGICEDEPCRPYELIDFDYISYDENDERREVTFYQFPVGVFCNSERADAVADEIIHAIDKWLEGDRRSEEFYFVPKE